MVNAVNWEAAASRTTGVSAATLAAGANVLSSEIDNSSNEDRFATLVIHATDWAAAPTENNTVELYDLYAVDGTNYERGDATPVDPKKSPAAIWVLANDTTAQRQVFKNIPIMPFKLKWLLKSEADQEVSVTLLCYTHNEEIQ